MHIDRAELFRLAWKWARQDEAYHWVYDWTPGKAYGTRRAATGAERRAIFAHHLKRAWAEMKRVANYRAAQAAAFAKLRNHDDIQAEILTFECKDTIRGADWTRLDALRAELHAAA